MKNHFISFTKRLFGVGYTKQVQVKSLAMLSGGLLCFTTACSQFNAKSNFDVRETAVAHMAAQARAKQLGEKDAQDALQKYILEYIEQHPDISNAELVKLINQGLSNNYNLAVSEKNFVQGQSMDKVGYPIQSSKTHLQLAMGKEWAKSQQEDLISQIRSGQFCHTLSNAIAPDALPALQSPSGTYFGGMKILPSGSALLASIATTFGKPDKNMAGAATCYGFLDPSLQFPDHVVTESYPFATKKGMYLMGAYQYGGHRNLKEPMIFGPEDCSSSVGKATYLTTEQIKRLTTNLMIEAYSNPENAYHYKPVTKLSGSVRDEQLRLIQPGDIYLVQGHTAIMATKPDNYSKVTTLQFNRDIDSLTNKLLGGGVYDYNLSEEVVKKPIYILRPSVAPLHESVTLEQFLHKVDTNYLRLFPNGPTDNATGDCRIFFENS